MTGNRARFDGEFVGRPDEINAGTDPVALRVAEASGLAAHVMSEAPSPGWGRVHVAMGWRRLGTERSAWRAGPGELHGDRAEFAP